MAPTISGAAVVIDVDVDVRGPPRRHRPAPLEMSGDHFVDSEPYAQGKATRTSRFTDAEGHTVLALGYPGERLHWS